VEVMSRLRVNRFAIRSMVLLGLFTLPWSRCTNSPRNLPLPVRLRLPYLEALDHPMRRPTVRPVNGFIPSIANDSQVARNHNFIDRHGVSATKRFVVDGAVECGSSLELGGRWKPALNTRSGCQRAIWLLSGAGNKTV
jgi:hypothetical protein